MREWLPLEGGIQNDHQILQNWKPQIGLLYSFSRSLGKFQRPITLESQPCNRKGTIFQICNMATMKGVVVAKAGAPFEVVETVTKPSPGPNEILVKSLVAGMNPMFVYLFLTSTSKFRLIKNK